MINLLPPELKQSYRYGLGNVILARWVAACVIALIGIGVIGTYGWLSFHQNITNYRQQVSSIQATLKKDKQKETYAQVQDISSSFRLVLQVLKNEVLFSKLLKQMATALPSGTYLTGLSIGDVKGSLQITAQATDYQSATQAQVNLADPDNEIFSKADIESITCQSTSTSDPSHPCLIVMKALFAQDNPFLFINQKAKP